MSDIAAGWKSDPTGRHDHRYWNGTAWTEHISDAGVAGVDPAPEGLAPPTAPDAPAAEEPTSTFRMTEEGTEPPATGDAADAPAATAAGETASEPVTPQPAPVPVTSSWATPTVVNQPTEAQPAADPDPITAAPESTDEPAAPPASSTPSYSSPVPPIASGTEAVASDEPTVVDAPSVEPDATDVITVASSAADPTSAWPTAASSAPVPPGPTFTPPAPVDTDGDEGGGGGSKRRLLLGVGVVAVIAVIVGVLLLGGGSDGDLQTRISSEIRDGGQSGLSKKEADCLAGELIDEMGADKLKDVDFSAEDPPAAIADDLNDAFVAAIPKCKIDLNDGTTGTTSADGSDAGSTDGATATSLSKEEIGQFRDMLADQYRDNLGLSEEKADCLANTMADAIGRGELDENQSFESFFQYLSDCDISVSELGGASGSG
jgi:hypothetical protein